MKSRDIGKHTTMYRKTTLPPRQNDLVQISRVTRFGNLGLDKSANMLRTK